MKVSVKTKLTEAIELSKKYPALKVRVMDMSRRHAIVCSSAAIWRLRVLDGWRTVAVFVNGKLVEGESDISEYLNSNQSD